MARSSPTFCLRFCLAAVFASGGCESWELDLEGPRIVRAPFAPGLEAIDGVAPRLRFEFDAPMDPTTVHAGSLALIPWPGDESCRLTGVCEDEESLCVAGWCVEDPDSSSLQSALEDGDYEGSIASSFVWSASARGPDTVLEVQPVRALEARRAHALFLGPAIRDRAGNPLGADELDTRALRVDFVTGWAEEGAPVPNLQWPAPGQRGLPTNLSFVELSFARPIERPGRLELESDLGQRSVGEHPEACEAWVPGSCWRWALPHGVGPAQRWRVAAVEAEDRHGRSARMPAFAAWFESGALADHTPPGLELGVSRRGPCTQVRGWVDEPVRVQWTDGDALRRFSATSSFELSARARSEARWGQVRIEDAAGGRHEVEVEIEAARGDIDLVITEVLINPEGDEAAGEFVELWRLASPGAPPRTYSGLFLSDLAWEEILAELAAGESPPGDPLQDFSLGAEGLAVVAGQNFDASEVAASAQLVRVDASIANGGLKNGGEPLTLYDPVGPTLWSSYGAQSKFGDGDHEGRSAMRSDPRACDAPSAWVSHPGLGRSPGSLP